MLNLMSVLTSGEVAGDVVESTSGSLSGLFDAGLQLADFAFDVFDLMTAHPVMATFIGVGLLTMAAALIGRLAGVSKSIA